MSVNETYFLTNNKPKFMLGKVESIDENYIITFSIPNILTNISVYPKAYPISGNHIQEIKINDTVLILQPEEFNHFFLYSTLILSNFTGMYFGNVRIDISDGKKVVITTDMKSNERGDDYISEMKSPNVVIDGENGLINLNDGDGINVTLNKEKDNVLIETKGGTSLEINGKDKTIKLGSSSYTLNQFFDDLDKAFKQMHSEGSPASHTMNAWYSSSLMQPFMKIKQVFPK